ncbi:UNVERIFIED_CONTAM: hypothetical protein FKN15_034424 [Acipenser sinensis]
MDESLDINGIPQLLIFVRATSRELDVTEDVLDMIPLQKGTKGEDIKLTAVDVLKKFEVAPEKITSITTDGVPAMLGYGYLYKRKAFMLYVQSQTQVVALYN